MNSTQMNNKLQYWIELNPGKLFNKIPNEKEISRIEEYGY